MEKNKEDKSKLDKSPSKMSREEAMIHLLELTSDIKFAMLTTQDKQGNLRSRPMQTVETTEDGTFWFFTSDHGGKADEVELDPRVNLSYAMPEKNRFISVSGMGEIVHDLQKKKELWKPSFKAWFAEGVDDSHCALLKVYVEKAEYWDTPSHNFVEVVGFTKALLTGETYKANEKGHQKIEFAEKPTSASKGV